MDEDAAAPLPPLDDIARQIVGEFETAWASARPTIRPFLEKHPARPLRLLVELAAIDLEHRVKRGEDATPERYEAEFPELATDAACVVELRQARTRGQAVLTTGFVTGHDQSFGLARAVDDASLTRSGTVVGTPMFMSPEQALGGTVDHRADLFSLGSLMYVMASGQAPFRAPSTVAVIKRLVDEMPRPIEEIIPETPPWLVDTISRLHAKKPEDRIQTAREVERLLANAQTADALAVQHPSGAKHAAAGCTAASPVAGTAPRALGWVATAVAVASLAGAAALYRHANTAPGVASSPLGTPPASPGPATFATRPALATPAPPLAVAPFDAAQARDHQEEWSKHLGVPIETTNSIGQTLVLIPPGQFTMGNESQSVSVTLTTPYRIGQTEVTQRQWKQVMGTEPWKGKPHATAGEDIAATQMRWGEAVDFCSRLTINTGACLRCA
jgi:hypothetical protein